MSHMPQCDQTFSRCQCAALEMKEERNEALSALGAMRERAETAEASLNSITGKTRERLAEEAFKRGFDAGVEHQKKAAPSPKAKQYRDALRNVLDALYEAHNEIPGYIAALLIQGTPAEATNRAASAMRRKAAIALAEGLLR